MEGKGRDRASGAIRWFAAAAAVLLTLAALNAADYLGRLDSPQNGQDFAAYYVPAAMLREGRTDIYAPDALRQEGEARGIYPDQAWAHPYLYPPAVAQALIPLTFLPYATARLVWFVLSCLALLAALAAVLRVTPPPARRWVALLWLTLPHHAASLYMGQADSFVAALLAFGYVGVVRARWRAAGAAIAAAAALKVTPVLIGAALLTQRASLRSGLPLLLSTGFAVLTTSALAAWVQGAPLLWLTYVAELPGLASITRDWVENVSLSGALRRLFLDSPHPFPGLLAAAPLLTVANLLAAVHALLAALLLGSIVLPPLLRKQPERKEDRGQRAYALAVVWLALAAPITWPSTLSLLAVPAAWLAGALSLAPSWGRVVAAGVAVGVLWLPNALLPELSLADWSYVRTAGLLALFGVGALQHFRWSALVQLGRGAGTGEAEQVAVGLTLVPRQFADGEAAARTVGLTVAPPRRFTDGGRDARTPRDGQPPEQLTG